MNYGSTCPPFTALILIFAKATRENAADAGRGLNRGGGGGLGERTLLAVPLTLWTCVSKLTAGDSSDSSQCCVGLRGGEGGTETYTHENFAHEGVRRGGGGKEAQSAFLPPVRTSIDRTSGP